MTLDLGEVFELKVGNDLTGTIITSDKKISVFGGNQCANVPQGVGFCDHIVEQLPPTTAWGRRFVTAPLATRVNGDTFRILAAHDGTTVTLNGVAIGTIDRGEFIERIIDGAATIDADKPVLIAQYSNGTDFDGVTSDPFMMLVPPFEQFLASYVVTTPATGFETNFINVVAPTAAIGSITLDGLAIPSSSFSPVGTSSFSAAQLPVELGAHALKGSQPFGVFVYGFDQFDSYGYPGGLAVASIASVDHLLLTPSSETVALGANACVSASVRDADNRTIPGVHVDFAVSGPNPGSSFAVSDANGRAAFCYTGQSPGDDTITASVGGVTAQAHKIWAATVQHTPVADAQSVTTNESTPKTITLTGSDAGGHALTFTVTSNPTHGSLSGTVPNLTYHPNASYHGADSFSFKTNDGLVDSAPAAVSITVASVNDAPVADGQSVTTNEDTPKAIALSASDVDGDPLTFSIVSGPSHGSLTGTGAAPRTPPMRTTAVPTRSPSR